MRYHVFVKSSFIHTREECESKRCSVARDPRCFKWKMLRESGP